MPRDWKGTALFGLGRQCTPGCTVPLVVAGSNTHNMTKQSQNKSRKVVQNHAFKGCREALLVPQPGSTPTTSSYSVTTTSTGQQNNAWVLAPLGLTSVVYGGTAVVAGTNGNVAGPPLRGLYNRAIDFQWYRVTRAKLVFVGSQGSTVTGVITLSGYTDPSDASAVTSPVYISGPNTRSFDLASSSGKELSVPVPVDSSWKKVSSYLSVVGNTYPYSATGATTVANVNTSTDLSFGAVGFYVGSAPNTTFLGTLYLDYDVEFKGAIDSSVNG